MREQDFFDGGGRFLDLYGLLGVSHLSGPDKIKKALRASRLVSHPDVTPEDREWAQRHHRKINLAEEVLLDGENRAFYDALYNRLVVPGTEALKEPPAVSKEKVPLRIRTVPVEGSIYLDGMLVARGSFTGKRPADRPCKVTFGEVKGYRAPGEDTIIPVSGGLEKTYAYVSLEERVKGSPKKSSTDPLPLRKAGIAALAALAFLAVILIASPERRNVPAPPGAGKVSTVPGDLLDGQRAAMERNREEYYMQRGREAFRSGDYRGCLLNMQRAVDINAGRAECYYYIYRSFAALGMESRARRAAGDVVRFAPGTPWAAEAESYLERVNP